MKLEIYVDYSEDSGQGQSSDRIIYQIVGDSVGLGRLSGSLDFARKAGQSEFEGENFVIFIKRDESDDEKKK